MMNLQSVERGHWKALMRGKGTQICNREATKVRNALDNSLGHDECLCTRQVCSVCMFLVTVDLRGDAWTHTFCGDSILCQSHRQVHHGITEHLVFGLKALGYISFYTSY